jgi:hydroxymethylpyrimidine pyrophosphatase-like HAD family hydrolase
VFERQDVMMQYLNQFNKIKNLRFDSFKKTLEIFKERELKTIVETGTARGKIKFFFFKKYNWKDGMSTTMFGAYVYNNSGHLYTCDISKKNIENSRSFTKKYSQYISYVIDDSINFLSNFDKKIDLLYLDSLDGHDPVSASNHQLHEIKAATKNMHKDTLILLDDKGTKTNLSLNYLIDHSYEILLETEYQILLSKEK